MQTEWGTQIPDEWVEERQRRLEKTARAALSPRRSVATLPLIIGILLWIGACAWQLGSLQAQQRGIEAAQQELLTRTQVAEKRTAEMEAELRLQRIALQDARFRLTKAEAPLTGPDGTVEVLRNIVISKGAYDHSDCEVCKSGQIVRAVASIH